MRYVDSWNFHQMFDFAFREATFIFILKKNKKNQKVCQTEVTFRTFLGLSQIFLNPLFAMYICTCCLLEFFILLFCSVSKLHNFVQSSCKTRVPLSSHYVLNYILVKTSIWIKNFRHSEKKICHMYLFVWCFVWSEVQALWLSCIPTRRLAQ